MTLSRHRLSKIRKRKCVQNEGEGEVKDQNETVQNSENENAEVQNEGEMKDQNGQRHFFWGKKYTTSR